MQLHTKATKANTKEYQKYIFCVLGIGIFFVLFVHPAFYAGVLNCLLV